MKRNFYTPKQVIGIVLGSLIFATSVNLFVVPMGLYNGGFIGISQIIRSCLKMFFGLTFSFDIAGIINVFLNIPLFIFSFNKISKRFLLGTFISLISQSIGFSFVPIPTVPLVDDIIASIVIAGIIGGFGVGMILSNNASGGGPDIIGVYAASNWKNFSVGKVFLILNFFVYSLCAYLFNFETAAYSIIYVAIFSYFTDKCHKQNIDMNMMIFTKKTAVKQMIMNKYGRGVTYWKGQGAYTNNETEVLVVICNKFEVESIRKDITQIDENAFIIVNEGAKVSGGYEKRLV
ncbi:MAG: YitT family protein [Erysipelotrichaceae bacterium]|nr:YitT family protein [Erysipelotrichaceae bacterium]MDY5252845.1 YitT family protein [Erysipelotrichaceae bacterium]